MEAKVHYQNIIYMYMYAWYSIIIAYTGVSLQCLALVIIALDKYLPSKLLSEQTKHKKYDFFSFHFQSNKQFSA